jgi:hypothetical protein
MTEAFDRTLHRVAEHRWFEDLTVGERFFIPSRTMTEAHFAAFQSPGERANRSPRIEPGPPCG